MRSLRDRLKMIVDKPPEPERLARTDSFFRREKRVSVRELHGIERTTLDEIQACDPQFTGTSWDVRRVLFVDTETTGLSGGAGTVAFEIGIGFIDDDEMVIRQYVMRDYGEEAAMLNEIAALFRQFDTVVTFNGKSFDLPLLQSRMIMNRIRLPLTDMPHLDLLHIARRVYKLRLKRCNLASLEEAVLGQERDDDLPGSQVPQRYFDYVRTKEFALLEDVLRHNWDDVKSLASLTGHLCAVFREPEQIEHPQDMLGVSRTLLRSGRVQTARTCLKILGHSSVSAQAHLVLASSYKRDREWTSVVETYRAMIERGDGGSLPYIELAKYYEHIAKDTPRALSYAKNALRIELNRVPLGQDNLEQQNAIQKRISRLMRKRQVVGNR